MPRTWGALRRSSQKFLETDSWIGIVVEVQLKPEAFQLASLRSRFESSPRMSVLLAGDDSIQEDCSVGSEAHHDCPGHRLEPLVVGPEGIPIILDPARAKRDPELAVLSVMAHGHGDVETAAKIAFTAATGVNELDEDTRVLYLDLIESALSAAPRKALELPVSRPFLQKGQTRRSCRWSAGGS